MPRVFVPPKKKGKSKAKNSNVLSGDAPPGFIDIDANRLRFQHSKIRTHFSGCGRSVMETLESIREGILSPHDLPPIQVIVGPDENDGKGPWYFALNNRRAWVLKRCREENLLENNLIRVRYRKPKTPAEGARYTLENCATDAKFMKNQGLGEEDVKLEADKGKIEKDQPKDANHENETADFTEENKERHELKEEDSYESSSEEEKEIHTKVYKNPFSAVANDSSDESDDE